MKIKIIGALVASAIVGFGVQAQMSDDDIAARIKPVGKVHVAGAVAEVAGSVGAKSGEEVYSQACVACHSTGVLGAPKFQVAAEWKPRLEKGMDTLLTHAINGFNSMPARGTCTSCSDDEIKAAIEYMTQGI